MFSGWQGRRHGGRLGERAVDKGLDFAAVHEQPTGVHRQCAWVHGSQWGVMGSLLPGRPGCIEKLSGSGVSAVLDWIGWHSQSMALARKAGDSSDLLIPQLAELPVHMQSMMKLRPD